MSDTPQGQGWWQASDDKWYPPPRPQMPGEEPAASSAPATTVAPPYGAPSSGGFPAGPPTTPSYPGGPDGPGGPPPLPGAQPSPYGVPPVGAPPGATPNRTPLFIVLGVLVAAGLVGMILLLSSGGGNDPDPPATTVTPNTTGGQTPGTTGGQTPATTVAGGGGEVAAGEIKVLESGFSVYTDQLSEDERLSYAYTIQNDSDQVATSVPITVAFLDDGGTVVGTADQTVGVLLPGQKMGLGDEPYDVAAGTATMQVTVGEPSSWEAPGDYGEITADGISTSIDDYGAPTSSFTAASTYGEQIDSPYAYAVYRNAAGKIVGGSYGFINFLPANGSTAGEVTSYSSIPDIDASKTEVYVDPGYMF